MPEHREWTETVAKQLAREGLKAGGARAAVVRALSRHDCCVSAQEIARELSDGGEKVGLASVYRTLDLLHREELVLKVDLGDGSSRFEPALPGGEHHHHVICDTCGEVTPFEDASLEQSIDRLGRRMHRTVKIHDVVLHADCASCAPSS
jgi:Fur family ferric uptake transcriptional regulator